MSFQTPITAGTPPAPSMDWDGMLDCMSLLLEQLSFPTMVTRMPEIVKETFALPSGKRFQQVA